MRVWGLTSGNAGMVAQVRALSEALGVTPELKIVVLNKCWAWVPNSLFKSPLAKLILPYALSAQSDRLQAPWPELVISCGRRAAMAALGVKAQTGVGTRFIHIQDPQVDPRLFDVVVAMQHDKVRGPNVISMRYALHRVTRENLSVAAQQFLNRFASYSTPRIAVLLGGSTNKYHFTQESMAMLLVQLQQLLKHTTGSLLITPSKRTGEANIAMLRQHFAANPRVYIYDFVELNPYMALLALCESIIVTDDSVNMMSEAQATGKPIYILPLPGHKHTKPWRFANMLIQEGSARPLSYRLEQWEYAQSDEMVTLAEQVRSVMDSA